MNQTLVFNIIYNIDSHQLGDALSAHEQFFKTEKKKILLVNSAVCMEVYFIFKIKCVGRCICLFYWSSLVLSMFFSVYCKHLWVLTERSQRLRICEMSRDREKSL